LLLLLLVLLLLTIFKVCAVISLEVMQRIFKYGDIQNAPVVGVAVVVVVVVVAAAAAFKMPVLLLIKS